MKKIKIAVLAFIILYFFRMALMASLIGGAGASAPVEVFATEEQAYEYQYIGSELGVPWDIVLLADGISAKQENKSGIEEYNPLLTSLQFCTILEERFKWEKYGPGEDPDPDDDIKGHWVSDNVFYHYAADNILQYIGKTKLTLDYRIAGRIIADINETAENKSSGKVKYVATLISNPDHEDVLLNYIGLTPEYTEHVLELYDSQYLVYLYGYKNTDEDYEVVLPPPVEGEVTREQLARVTVALINHPYQLGGKSSKAGPPDGPLDCSGYVDWVYIQCFGKGVSSGRLPSGVAVSGTAMQFYACSEIDESELKVGDLGFLYDPAKMASGKINHVGIYIGTIGGQKAFIHCAGKYYGYDVRPSGRVGISVSSGTNNRNNVLGTTFSPAMKSCSFHYFRRPNFEFAED